MSPCALKLPPTRHLLVQIVRVAPPLARMNFDAIAKRLALTDDQKTKAKPVFVEMMQKMRDLRQDSSLQPADRRAKVKEIRDAATVKLKDILTAEQLDKWQKMGPGNRRPPAGDAKPPQ